MIGERICTALVVCAMLNIRYTLNANILVLIMAGNAAIKTKESADVRTSNSLWKSNPC